MYVGGVGKTTPGSIRKLLLAMLREPCEDVVKPSSACRACSQPFEHLSSPLYLQFFVKKKTNTKTSFENHELIND